MAEEEEEPEPTTLFDLVCQVCSVERRIEPTIRGWVRWRGGIHIQHALPELTEDDREMLISRTCPECWDDSWGDEDQQ